MMACPGLEGHSIEGGITAYQLQGTSKIMLQFSPSVGAVLAPRQGE